MVLLPLTRYQKYCSKAAGCQQNLVVWALILHIHLGLCRLDERTLPKELGAHRGLAEKESWN